MDDITLILTFPAPEEKPSGSAWFHIKSTDEEGDVVTGLQISNPDLKGYTPTLAKQVSEGCGFDFGDAVPLLAFFKQAPYQAVGCGSTWALMSFL